MTATAYTPHANTTIDLWIWWLSLTSEQQNFLRISVRTAPLSRHVVEFLALTECPLAHRDHDWATATVTDSDALTRFIGLT